MLVNFTEAVSVADEDEFGFTAKGLDTYFDVMEHFATGGNIYNFPGFNSDKVVTVLAVGWAVVRNVVITSD